ATAAKAGTSASDGVVVVGFSDSRLRATITLCGPAQRRNPGGIQGSGTEAILRSYRREPYRLKWDGKLGFVQFAARHRATLLFVAGLGIDEMYYQTDVRMPVSAIRYGNAGADYYRGARLQIGAAGIHVLPGVLPLPVRVTHVISPPLTLDPALDPDDPNAVARAHIALWAESQAFLDAAVVARESDLLDRGFRSAMTCLQRLGV
ncbi:MAG: hypothetical protein ABIR79_01370, partial [Candidatus Binatia bacterium]